MKVLVLGGDGRAHALIWKLFSSPQITDLICAPGNGGTALLVPQAELDAADAVEVARWAFDEQIDLIIPAAGTVLQAGLVDEVVAMHIGVCGPSQRSTRIEQSRCFAKEFLQRHQLPTAPGRSFSDLDTAAKYLAAHDLPVVIKADHPAAGDGIYDDRSAALDGLQAIFAVQPVEGRNAGVVIESFLPGVRLSFSAITDGRTAVPLLPTRIYDRLEEDDQGPTAPAMGAHTATSVYAQKLTDYMHQRLIQPVVAGLAQENLPYWGFLGIDCIVTDRGPFITALRCSMRDQEAQVVLPRLADDLLPLLQAAISRRLDQLPPLTWHDQASVGIALVTQGYPHHFPVGAPINGLDTLDTGVLAFHNQTHTANGLRYIPVRHAATGSFMPPLPVGASAATPITTGGNVLSVVALNATLNGARGRAVLNAERINFSGRSYRGDIGRREFA